MPELLCPIDTVTLKFRDPEALGHVSDPIHKDLSTATRAAGGLFLSCDETAGVDRLLKTKKGWGRHEHFSLGEIFDLPAGPDGEMDIEGLCADDGWLWIVGSHSLTRGSGDLKGISKVYRNANRFFLGRVPLKMIDGKPVPVRKHRKRRAACLKLSKKGSKLKDWLDGDRHLGPFLDLPSKENGLDIEGIAVRGDRVYLGLRGPVLRNFGIVVELQVKVTKKGWLKARRIEGKRRYAKHVFDTHGQGIRDLAFDGKDLLMLTGTVMAGDGPSEILRWKNALKAEGSAVREAHHVADVPYRGEVDHPEGLVRWREAGKRAWMLVYDSPSEDRLHGEQTKVDADIVEL
ncbi:DUF3616 domain-containing protein [Roseobacter sp. HKCCA0434]|uniref:DUF3616 domain-containing protein n=1 Tax=Roseobacter sp. HKCCA0434 TaxID=3079297 RepID=UPI002905BD4F|nr:DUF3616 domain-containing protein [Roseobacter sp. HKCCA0434]